MELDLFDNIYDNETKVNKNYFITFGTGLDEIGFFEKSDKPHARKFTEKDAKKRLLAALIPEAKVNQVMKQAKVTESWVVYNSYELFF